MTDSGPNLGGRPLALYPDEKTLAIITTASSFMATDREIARQLGVVLNTFRAFRERHPDEVNGAMEAGRSDGKYSLRVKQFKMADTNPAMAIFLGKNWLDQADKTTTELTGPNGGAMVTRIELVDGAPPNDDGPDCATA